MRCKSRWLARAVIPRPTRLYISNRPGWGSRKLSRLPELHRRRYRRAMPEVVGEMCQCMRCAQEEIQCAQQNIERRTLFFLPQQGPPDARALQDSVVCPGEVSLPSQPSGLSGSICHRDTYGARSAPLACPGEGARHGCAFCAQCQDAPTAVVVLERLSCVRYLPPCRPARLQACSPAPCPACLSSPFFARLFAFRGGHVGLFYTPLLHVSPASPGNRGVSAAFRARGARMGVPFAGAWLVDEKNASRVHETG